MSHHLSVIRILVLLALLQVLCTARAEVPPLSQEALNSSPFILTGTVKSISKRDVFTDPCMVMVDVMLIVERDRSIESPQLPPYVHVRGHLREQRCKDRPPMPGPTGIWGLSALKEGVKVKIYAVSAGPDGTLSIQRPNGLEVIK